MPLLDHFRPPISEHHRWESFHSNWATRIADALVEDLPHGFAADEQTQSPDSFEVRVFSQLGGTTLVGVIELVSPANKDRPEERRAFATKVASFLQKGVSVITVDIVTNRSANLHRETLRMIDPTANQEVSELYAVAYRPVVREDRPEIDLWYEPLKLGEPLPTLPLRLTGDTFVPVDLEASYSEACARRRINIH